MSNGGSVFTPELPHSMPVHTPAPALAELQWDATFFGRPCHRPGLGCTPEPPAAFHGTRRIQSPLVTGCGRSGTHFVAALLQEAGLLAHHERYAPGAVSVSWLFAAAAATTTTTASQHQQQQLQPQSPLLPGQLQQQLLPGPVPFESFTSFALRTRWLARFSPVVLLVRHPLQAIASTRRCFCGKGTRATTLGAASDATSWTFVEQHLSLEPFLPFLVRPPESGRNRSKSTGGAPPAVVNRWSDLPFDDLRRSMILWVGWNSLAEQSHRHELAPANGSRTELAAPVTGRHDNVHHLNAKGLNVPLPPDHVVQVEDPLLPQRLARLLQLPPGAAEALTEALARRDTRTRGDHGQAVADLSSAARLQLAGADGRTPDSAKNDFREVTWDWMHEEAPALAQLVWSAAQRYGYHRSDPPGLAQFLRRKTSSR